MGACPVCPQTPVPGAVQRGGREAAFLTVSPLKLFFPFYHSVCSRLKAQTRTLRM